MSADAVMLTQPEGKMGIGTAVDPELVRVRENGFVTIGGIEKQRHRFPGPDRLAAELDVLSVAVRHVCRPGVVQRSISSIAVSIRDGSARNLANWSGFLDQRVHATAEAEGDRIVASGGEHRVVGEPFVVGHRLTLHLSTGDDAAQVMPRAAPRRSAATGSK